MLIPLALSLNMAHTSPKPSTLLEDHSAMTKMFYWELVGSLMYLAIGTQSDIMFTVNQLCHFLNCYGNTHWEAAKHVICYLKGTHTLHLVLSDKQVICLLGYSNSDYAACPNTHCSISGFCFSLVLGIISWCSCCQCVVTLSTCKAEYIAACEAPIDLSPYHGGTRIRSPQNWATVVWLWWYRWCMAA